MSDPAGPPLVFPPPRNPNDPGRGPMVIGITWAFTGMAVIACSLRMMVGWKRKRGLGIDDWLMFIAMLLQIVNQTFISISYSHGLGKHDADLQWPDQLVEVLKWNWIATAPGMFVSILARLSITILLLRLFGIHQWFKWFVYVLTTLQVIGGILCFVVTWVQVRPIEALWNVFLPNAERIDPNIVLYSYYFGQSTYTFADLTYVICPIFIIWRLNMRLHQRVGLAIVMGVSIFTVVMSIMKTITAVSGTTPREDAQYDAALTVLWASGEQACVVLLGCVPALRALPGLDYSRLRSLGDSLSRLGWSKRSMASNSGKSFGIYGSRSAGVSSAYHDLENNTHKLGRLGNHSDKGVTGTVATYADDTGSSKSLVTDGQVRRTDVFTIDYNQQGGGK
ncbi:hypothetical protein B0T21DRAFT_454743 [Apiosordaria backusii]|uniref:Rhodopsin domain-containing protein n=1 Tax=Apiosordaria backusii TaxID=314023 RepID=A0AA40AAD6_9PEZI|nr:hypothetical protein B0T21DRAFT_454743 [Apiosordaria backusii]